MFSEQASEEQNLIQQVFVSGSLFPTAPKCEWQLAEGQTVGLPTARGFCGFCHPSHSKSAFLGWVGGPAHMRDVPTLSPSCGCYAGGGCS